MSKMPLPEGWGAGVGRTRVQLGEGEEPSVARDEAASTRNKRPGAPRAAQEPMMWHHVVRSTRSHHPVTCRVGSATLNLKVTSQVAPLRKAREAWDWDLTMCHSWLKPCLPALRGVRGVSPPRG
ncbi:hypothetical protein B296_00045800 [Ensete ventricosum]|uniref:Uncharacterized protein n=1 Tax=Ensete ventricosum TaxID=4639 RepID=A0A426YNT8_ENSVE|nr:hypothetical protein B296_00045800 [Ensete ventricosum]